MDGIMDNKVVQLQTHEGFAARYSYWIVGIETKSKTMQSWK